METKPEILIYMSDQHSAVTQHSTADSIVETPFLDELGKRAYVFDNAYTSCPLCVPARASFMTSRLPSEIGVFSNADDFKSSEITFPHLLGANGYHSTLIGRMHLVGPDQLHGFDEHVGKDITAPIWGTPGSGRKDWGEYRKGFAAKTTMSVLGTGDSPVLEFDRHVETWTRDTLDNCNGDEPQLFVVGTYGPHFPYVGDRELMEKYLEKEPLSEDKACRVHPGTAKHVIEATARQKAIARAAYRSLVEIQDRHIESVYNEFRKYLDRRGRKGIFIYLSDHGDMCGKRDMYGKKVFYEPSSHIPLYMEIIGELGHHIRSSVSIMDVGPTLAEITGSPEFPVADGRSFLSLLAGEDEERFALSEFYEEDINPYHGLLVHRNGKKMITYSGHEGMDELYDSENDVEEMDELSGRENKLKKELTYIATPYMDEAEMRISQFKLNREKPRILNLYGSTRQERNIPSTDMLSFEGKTPEPIN